MDLIKQFDITAAKLVGRMPRNLTTVFRYITALGALSVTAGICGVTAYLLWSSDSGSDSYRDSGGLLLALFGAGMGLKVITKRPRPDTIFAQSMRFKHFSFPSGHAYGSTLAYGFLAYLAASWPAYITAGVLVGLIGLSRIYLGAHFPSDVAGGWLMGIAALTVVIAAANRL